jgi:hypothetical protein
MPVRAARTVSPWADTSDFLDFAVLDDLHIEHDARFIGV